MKIEIEHSISKELKAFLTELVNQLNQQESDMAADLTLIKNEIEELTNVVDSVVALLDGLVEQLRNAGVSQEAIDELTSAIQAQKQELAEAVAANTEGGGGGEGTARR